MKVYPNINQDIWLLIPAFNVGRHIEVLLKQVFEYVAADRIIVVDDGSTDETANLAEANGVAVISNSRNMGKGIALHKGFEYIFEHGGDWIITIDGDLQHNPDDLPAFISCALSGSSDIVIGDRTNRAGMPLDRRLSNWLSSLTLSLVTGVKIKDGQCGYRLLRTSKLKRLELYASYYDFETEYLLKMLSMGAKLEWVQIETIYQKEESSIRRFSDTVRFIKMIISHMFRARQGNI